MCRRKIESRRITRKKRRGLFYELVGEERFKDMERKNEVFNGES